MNRVKHVQGEIRSSSFRAGVAAVDVTPRTSCFLYGYPHVPRMSTGTRHSLLASAIALDSGDSGCVFASAEVIFLDRALTTRVRERVSRATSLRPDAILLSATHTHSGPVTVRYLSNRADPVVPDPDLGYLRQLEDGLVEACVSAWNARQPAELASVVADATGIGTCRHDPTGPRDLQVPVLAVRSKATNALMGLMPVCNMHPTVLHEDSTLFSGDFPACAREDLQHVYGHSLVVVHHTGASGDQSPRHVTRGNTFEEAERLGGILSAAIQKALDTAAFSDAVTLDSAQSSVSLPPRAVEPIGEALHRLSLARQRLSELKSSNGSPVDIRTAQCDVFGAEETLALAEASQQGLVAKALDECLPAELQAIRVNDDVYIGWPGEFFVEFALELRKQRPAARVITLANGHLQGYVVTQSAIDRAYYEAGNSLFRSPDAGAIVVARTIDLIDTLDRRRHA